MVLRRSLDRRKVQDLPQNATVMESVYKQVLFWVPFEILRPFLAAQPVTPLSNDKEGNMNYAEFFGRT